MKLIKQLLVMAVPLFLYASNACANQIVEKDELQLAIEAYKQQDYEAAIRHSFKAEEMHIDDYATMVVRERSYYALGQYGWALTTGETALKSIPYSKKEDRAYVLCNLADVYLALEDTTKAMAYYTSSIQTDPSYSEPYSERAELYYLKNDFEKSDIDYRKYIELQPGASLGYMGLGRNCKAQRRYKSAVAYYDKVIKMYGLDYPAAYAFRAECELLMGRKEQAADDIVATLGADYNRKALGLIFECDSITKSYIIDRMKFRHMQEPNLLSWPYYIAFIYENDNNYVEAIKYYKKINNNPAVARCFACINCPERAIRELSDTVRSINKVNVLVDLEEYGKALHLCKKMIEENPGVPELYHTLGWVKFAMKDYEGAEDAYNTEIILSKTPNAYHWRALARLKLGKKELAMSDYKQSALIQPDSSDEMFGYYRRGYTDKALSLLKQHIAENGEDYNVACMYAVMGNIDKALQVLEKCLAEHMVTVSYVKIDTDWDRFRNHPTYKTILKKQLINDKILVDSNF